MNLNARAGKLAKEVLAASDELRVVSVITPGAGTLIDCGVNVPGGLGAGLALARICLAGLGHVTLVAGEVDGRPCLRVQVVTDHPTLACLGSQYAGWQLAEGKFFAMGSGPMRAAYASEPIFARIGYSENPQAVVGVLEGRKLPPASVVASVAQACRVEPDQVTLLIAPTASLAGGLQVVARSVETALHKLAELDFELSRIVSAHGSAPLPPVAKGDLEAIGRTNDAVLYGARVVLQVRGDDESLAELGARVPSCASKDHGEPFAAIFKRYNHDFYAVDPHLFSPAEVVFENLDTGRTQVFGRVEPAILARSFYE